MKKITILFVMAIAAMSAWAQADELKDVIYTSDNKTIEAKVMEVSSQEVKYKDWNNQNGPMFILMAGEVTKIEFSNGTVKTFAAPAPAAAAPVATTPVKPVTTEDQAAASEPKKPAEKLPVGFQFNVDLDGNLAFVSGSRIDGKGGIQSIDRDFAVGGVNLTLGAGARIAQWLYAGVAAGVLGEWGTPKVRYTNKDGVKEEGKATYSAYTVPIYADVRAFAPTHGNCYPYVEVGVGGYVGIAGTTAFNGNKIEELCGTPEGGFYFISGVGLEFKYFNVGAGYKRMQSNNFTGNHGYVKLGVSFGRCNKLRNK